MVLVPALPSLEIQNDSTETTKHWVEKWSTLSFFELTIFDLIEIFHYDLVNVHFIRIPMSDRDSFYLQWVLEQRQHSDGVSDPHPQDPASEDSGAPLHGHNTRHDSLRSGRLRETTICSHWEGVFEAEKCGGQTLHPHGECYTARGLGERLSSFLWVDQITSAVKICLSGTRLGN